MNIKFRSWDKKEKIMCEVGNINFGLGCFLIGNSPTPEKFTDKTYSPGTKDGHFVKFDDLILMQSTTLLDINGVEIYDKDIIKFQSSLYLIGKSGSGYKLYDLNCELDETYDGDIGRFDCENLEDFLCSLMEVIGNIFTYKK